MTIILLALMASPRANAATTDCRQQGAPSVPSTSNLADLRVPRDLPVGGAIPGSRVAITWSWTCASTGLTGGKRWTFTPEWDWTAVRVPGLSNVYQVASGATGVSGIGFRILNSSGVPLAFDEINYKNAVDMGDAVAGQTSFRWSGFVELVKTSATVSAGTGSMWFFGAVVGQVWGNYDKPSSKFTYSYTISKTALETCTVTNKTTNVSMLQARMSDLTSVGSTTRPTAFDIKLNCSDGATLYLTLTDNSNTSNTSNTLTPTADSTAEGVAFQLSRDNGTIISFGPDSATAGNTHQFQIGATSSELVSIPLKAAYIRTGEMVSGKLDGKATFTLSYQ